MKRYEATRGAIIPASLLRLSPERPASSADGNGVPVWHDIGPVAFVQGAGRATTQASPKPLRRPLTLVLLKAPPWTLGVTPTWRVAAPRADSRSRPPGTSPKSSH